MQVFSAISAIMELVNAMYTYRDKMGDSEGERNVFSSAMATVITTLSPITPHICEELWQIQGFEGLASEAGWPEHDEAKMVDTEKTIATSCIPWITKDVGVWIDIFPVDRVPDDKETFERIYDALLILMKSNVGIRRVHTISSSGFSIYKRLKIWTLKKINPRLAKRDPNAIVNDMNALISLLSPEHSQHWSQLCCPDVGTNEFFRDEDINEYVSLKFEDCDFFAWKGYDRILRDSYGDYMTLPPENKRKPLQNYIKFRWKE